MGLELLMAQRAAVGRGHGVRPEVDGVTDELDALAAALPCLRLRDRESLHALGRRGQRGRERGVAIQPIANGACHQPVHDHRVAVPRPDEQRDLDQARERAVQVADRPLSSARNLGQHGAADAVGREQAARLEHPRRHAGCVRILDGFHGHRDGTSDAEGIGVAMIGRNHLAQRGRSQSLEVARVRQAAQIDDGRGLRQRERQVAQVLRHRVGAVVVGQAGPLAQVRHGLRSVEDADLDRRAERDERTVCCS